MSTLSLPSVLPALFLLALPACRAAAVSSAVPAPAAINGRVVDPYGRPLAGIPVRSYAGAATRWQTAETVTDAAGRFSFPEALGSLLGSGADGAYEHYVGLCAGSSRGGNPAEYLPWRDLRVPSGGCVYVELVLDQAAVEAWVAAHASAD